MGKDTTQLFNFLDLMREYKIEIPKIQRDYAQGRLSSSAIAAREEFAKKLVRALVGEESLMLDFIYGTKGIDDDKRKILYPLDGQQRLTTLFLLACLCQCTGEKWTFSYESRRSAKFFMEELQNRDNMSVILSRAKEIQTDIISDIIKKSPWFFASWEEEVNITGMLRMLDALYREIRSPKYAGKQFDFSRITFYVMPIPGNSTDFEQIYLKMNARGKALSSWDNLKACLNSVIPEKDKDYWNDCFNLKWPDLLWNLSGNRVENVDASMEMVVCYALAATFETGRYVDTNWEEDDGKTTKLVKSPVEEVKLEHIIKNEKINQGRFDAFCNEWIYIPKADEDGQQIKKARFQLCQERQNFLIDFFEVLDTFFSCLTEDEAFFNQQMSPWNLGIQKPDVCALAYGNDNQKKDNNRKRLLVFYALKKSKATDAEKAKDWRRIVWNLVYNTPITDIKKFRVVFLALKKLGEYSEDILASIVTIKSNGQLVEELENAFDEQWSEECKKSKRINASDDVPVPRGFSSWKNAIVTAEKHAFFQGRISFLFHDENGNVDWKLFETKFANSQLFFDDAGVTELFCADGLLLKLLYTYIDDYWKLGWISFDSPRWRDAYLSSRDFQKATHKLLVSTEQSRQVDIEQKSNQVKDSDDVLWTILKSDVICYGFVRLVNPNTFELTVYSIDGVNFIGYTNYSSRWSNWGKYIILNDPRKRLLRKLGIKLAKEYSSFYNCWDFEYNGLLFRWYNSTDEKRTAHSRIFIALSEHDRMAWGNDIGFEQKEKGVNLAPSAEVDLITEQNLNDDNYLRVFLSKLEWLGKQTIDASIT